MPLSVSDARSNPKDQIAHAVEVLGRSRQRISIFEAIYRGKQKVKTVNELALATGLSRIRVLTEGKRLADNQIVRQIRAAGMTAYEKDPFYAAHRDRILRYTRDARAFAQLPTKTRPQPSAGVGAVVIRIPAHRIRARLVTVDEIDSFGRVKGVRVEAGEFTRLPETRFKRGVQRILGDSGKFSDWGGERSDLFTTRVKIGGRRRAAAFAFKGPGKKGILRPGGMGKNGDQIQRLFKTPAAVFIVQYWGQVDDSVIEQMEEFAKAKSAVEDQDVFYGVIDGDDSNRLIAAYPRAFAK